MSNIFDQRGQPSGLTWKNLIRKKKKKMEKQNVAKKAWDLGWRPEKGKKRKGKFLRLLEETFISASLRPGPLLMTSSPEG